MDPITAIGLVGNILGFVDFAGKLFSSAKEIYTSATGDAESDRSVKSVVRHVRDLASELKPSSSSALGGDPDAKALKELAQECFDLADDLADMLETFQAREKSKRVAFRAVWNRMMKAEQKKDLQDRLSQCTAALNLRLNAYTGSRLLGKMEQVIQQHKTDLASLQSRIDAMQQGIPASALSTEALAQIRDALHLGTEAVVRARTRLILAGLRFDKMESRLDEIGDAHDNTFEWLLEESDGARDTGDDHAGGSELLRSVPCMEARQAFHHWFKSPADHLFFVKGKPGSGKSTLMKFLSKHPITRQKLESSEWAQGSSVVIASHYFWNPGTELQNSIFGMYRTLLHQILQAHPQLTSTVLPDHWEDTASIVGASLTPNFSEMQAKTALHRLMTEPAILAQNKMVLVLFIDGLDEFKPRGTRETYDGLAAMIKEWAVQSHGRIKICVSSREWPIIIHDFDQCPKLRLQDLTEGDIRQYVQDFIRNNPHFKSFDCGKKFRHDVSENVIRRSAGVFLWVTVVLRNLAEGICEGDSGADLKKTLESLPLELDELYHGVLRSLKKNHQQYTFNVLRLAHASATSLRPMDLPLVRYYFLELIIEHFPREVEDTLGRFSSLPKDESRALMDKELGALALRMSARCRGLVEIVPYRWKDEQGYLYHRRVVLFHRSLHEFLSGDDAEELLNSHSKKSNSIGLWSRSLQTHIRLAMDSPLPQFGWLPERTVDMGFPRGRGGLESELEAFFTARGFDQSRHLGRDLLESIDPILKQHPHVSGIVTSEDCAYISSCPSKFLRQRCLACHQSSPLIQHFAIDKLGLLRCPEYLMHKYRDFAAFSREPAHRYVLGDENFYMTNMMISFFSRGMSPNYSICSPQKAHTPNLAAQTVWHRCILLHTIYAHTFLFDKDLNGSLGNGLDDHWSIIQASLACGVEPSLWFVFGELQSLNEFDVEFWWRSDFGPRDLAHMRPADSSKEWYPVQLFQVEGSHVQPVAHSAFLLHERWSLLQALRFTDSGTAYLHFSELVPTRAEKDIHRDVSASMKCSKDSPPDEFFSRRVVPNLTWSEDSFLHVGKDFPPGTSLLAFLESFPDSHFPRGSLRALGFWKKRKPVSQPAHATS